MVTVVEPLSTKGVTGVTAVTVRLAAGAAGAGVAEQCIGAVALVGAKAGDKKTVKVTFPKDYGAEKLRGVAAAQVPNCQVGVYGGYTGHMASTLVLTKDR